MAESGTVPGGGLPVPRSGHRPAPLEALEAEIRAEIASSLGRIGEQLDRRLLELAQIQGQVGRAAGAERTALVAKFNHLRQEAREYFWYLMVQREAIGLRNHRGLEEHYPIPSALRP